jgi:alkanesulfonate monooxygenase SsuD/methylene tetrahydromethanopterin reductase-like flavin-dependent oxidoreductase (luciferase family)
MDVGVYFDLRNPPGWRQDWNRLYRFTLEAIQEAEHLGAGSVWLSEHHLFEDGYLNQPLTFASAVAARTSRVRIGTAIIIAPFWNPVQLAEEATVIDLISNGRLDLGIGAGYRVPEYDLFDADLSRRYSTTDATARRLREIWSDPAHQPQPVQERLPIWMGYMGPQGARRAGVLGEGLLSADRRLHAPYLEGLRDGGHDVSSARMSGALFGYATEDPDADWPTFAKHYGYQTDSYRRYMVEGTGNPMPDPIDPERARSKGLNAAMGGVGFGTPEEIAAQTRELIDGLPVEAVFFWASFAGMPEEMVMRHIRTICTRVAPLLQD